MLSRLHKSTRVLFFFTICAQTATTESVTIGNILNGALNCFDKAIAQTDGLSLARIGLREPDHGEKPKPKPYFDHISIEGIFKAIAIGGTIAAIKKTFGSTDSFRYHNENNMYRRYGEGGSKEGNSWTGNVDQNGQPYRPPHAEAEYNAAKDAEQRRKQQELNDKYVTEQRQLIEEHEKQVAESKKRAQERQEQEENEKQKQAAKFFRPTSQMREYRGTQLDPNVLTMLDLDAETYFHTETHLDPNLEKPTGNSEPEICHDPSWCPPLNEERPDYHFSPLDRLNQEFKYQNPDTPSNSGAFEYVINPYDQPFKEHLITQAYNYLCTPGTTWKASKLDAQLDLVHALVQLQDWTLLRNPEEAHCYNQLAAALYSKADDDDLARTYKLTESALPSREVLFSDPAMDLQTDIDMAKILVKDSKRILKRSQELLVERGHKAIDNPLETAGTIAAGVALSPCVLGGIFAWQLIINHKEFLRDSKDFLRLLRDDTPEGIAKMLVFCIEIAVQHKVASGIAGTPQLVQVKSMLKECVKEATKEQGAAIAARARGIKLETPHADMFKGAHDAAKLATAEKTTLNTGTLKAAETVEQIKKHGIEKIESSSICKDVREAGSRYKNTATNVTKTQFENNLQKDGWNQLISKDGLVTIFEKDGARYVVRDNAKSTGGPTADYYKSGSQSIDCKIRLGEK